jgi:hypothetical protein
MIYLLTSSTTAKALYLETAAQRGENLRHGIIDMNEFITAH